jgi:hypothetical protein
VALRRRWSRVAARHLVSVLLAAVGAGLLALPVPAGAATISAGAQLRAAVARMQGVGGYSFSAIVGSGAAARKVKIAGEYEAPDRIHEVVQVGTGPASELVMIGSEVYAKSSAGLWQRTRAANGTRTDLRSTFAALAAARQVKRNGAGASFVLGSTASKRLAGSQATGTTTGRVTFAGARIARLDYTSKVNGAKVPVQIDYTVTDPPPTVSAPI